MRVNERRNNIMGVHFISNDVNGCTVKQKKSDGNKRKGELERTHGALLVIVFILQAKKSEATLEFTLKNTG